MWLLIKNKLFIIISALSFFGLCLSRDVRWDILLGVCFICVLIVLILRKNKLSKNVFDNKTSVVLAFILSATAFINFYSQMTEENGIPKRILANYGIDIHIAAAAVGLVFFTISLLSTVLFTNWMLKATKPIIQSIFRFRKEFIILSLVYILSIVAIIRADFYYIDDIGRATQGYQLTGSFSRFIATFMSNLFHTSTWLTDISPLAQIIAALIMAVSSILLLSVFNLNDSNSIWKFIAVIPMGISPYFLSCLSYKYDSPYMAASVLFSVIPLLYRNKKPYQYMIAVFIGTLLMCMTYQASSGIFPMAVVMLMLFMWQNHNQIINIVKFCICSIIGYTAAMLFFKIALVTEVVEAQDYVDSNYSLLNIFKNTSSYTSTFLSDFGAFWTIFLLIVMIAFVVSVYLRSKTFASIIAAIGAIVITYILAFGAYLLLDHPLMAPRAMYGVGVWIALIAIPIFSCEKMYIGKSTVIVLSWIFIVFSFTYGNALSVQKEYSDFRTELIIEEIKGLDTLNTDQEVIFQIDGTIGHAKNVKNMIKKYPILERSVPIMLKGNFNYWGHFKLMNYYGIDNLRWNSGENKTDLKDMDLPIVSDNTYQTIKANEKYIEIILKQNISQ